MLNNRHKYILRTPLGKLELDCDPMGWDKSKTKVGRSESTYGIFLTETNNLQFTGKAKDLLEDNFEIFGVQAEVKLTRFIKHPKTDEWQLDYTGYLDFMNRKIEDNKLQLDFIEGGLREVLVSQKRESFAMDRTTDIKGNAIPPLKTDTLTLEGREIFQLSKLNSKDTTEFVVKSGTWNSQGDYREAFRPAPMETISNSDPANVGEVLERLGAHNNHTEGGSETKFFALADRDLGKTRFTINLSFNIADVRFNDNAGDTSFKVFLRRYKDESEAGGSEFTPISPDVELIQTIVPQNNIGQSFSKELELIFEGENQIKKGESFGLYFYTNGIYAREDILDSGGGMDVYLDNYSGSITIETDSFFKRTNSKILPLYNVGERLTEIYTGRPSFRSKLLTEKWPTLGLTCGFWLRNMSKTVETEEGEQQEEERTMTINFDEFYKSVHAIEPAGYGIATEGNKQYVVLEELKYFFQPTTTIKLGKVSKVKRRTAKEFVFSSITTGYTKGGNYEQPLGLDEYNVQSSLISPITKEDASKYEVLSPSRADAYAVEQCRRKPAETNPEEDTPYDRDNFIIDCIALVRGNQGTTTWQVRKWQEDFEKKPTGVYSPDTAFNFRLTPKYNFLRHSYWFNAETIKQLNESYRYASSEGNVDLSTKLTGKREIKESADEAISQFSKPLFNAEWIEFELPFTQEVKNQILGKTKVGGEEINNYYGKMEFINEKGLKEKAFLFDCEIGEKITFKTLKAYGS